MARKKSSSRRSKPVYLFIVEGFTERNYIQCLKRVYRKDAKIENCKGGSAKAVMQKAKRLISMHRDNYTGYVIWFDRDTYYSSQDTNLKTSLESKTNVAIFISEPCVENWLLAHFDAMLSTTNNCDACERKLTNFIPTYSKNDERLLYRWIDAEKIRVAIASYPEIGKIPKRYFKAN